MGGFGSDWVLMKEDPEVAKRLVNINDIDRFERNAPVVELADTQDLGSCAARRGGSNPSGSTNRNNGYFHLMEQPIGFVLGLGAGFPASKAVNASHKSCCLAAEGSFQLSSIRPS